MLCNEMNVGIIFTNGKGKEKVEYGKLVAMRADSDQVFYCYSKKFGWKWYKPELIFLTSVGYKKLNIAAVIKE